MIELKKKYLYCSERLIFTFSIVNQLLKKLLRKYNVIFIKTLVNQGILLENFFKIQGFSGYP